MRPARLGWIAGTFAALRQPAYRRLWLTVCFNFAALWVAIVARGYLIFDLSGSAAALGLSFLGFGLPMLVLGPIGGVVADRYPRRTVLIAAMAFFTATTALLTILVLSGRIELWMLILGSAAEGVGVALGIPSRNALAADLVEPDVVGNAVALQQVSFNAMRIFAPTVAGALIAVPALGIGGAYVLQTLLYAGALVVAVTVPVTHRRSPATAEPPLDAILGGLRYIRSRPAIFALVAMGVAVNTTLFTYQVFLPAVVRDLFDRGSVELGLLNTAIAVGALAAALWTANNADREGAWRLFVGASAFFGVTLMLFALAPAYPVALVLGVALGAGEIGFLSLLLALAMRYAHPEFQGRVQSVIFIGFALNGLAGWPFGLLADAIGLRTTLLAIGLVGTAFVVAIGARAHVTGVVADALLPGGEPAPEG